MQPDQQPVRQIVSVIPGSASTLPPIATTQDNAPTQSISVPIAGFAGPHRTNALSIDEIVDEGRRRVQLYRGSTHPASTDRDRADAVEAFLHWIEAAR